MAPKSLNSKFIAKVSQQFPHLGYHTLAKLLGYSYTGVRNAIIKEGLKKEFERNTENNLSRHFMSEEANALRHQRIAENRKKNGTHKPSKKTRRKISRSVRASWGRQPWDTTSKGGNPKKYLRGYYNKIFYRSSYELKFLQLCRENRIKIRSCDDLKINLVYTKSDGRRGLYRPDFIDIETQTVYEVKPESMLLHGDNLEKFKAASRNFVNFVVITEKDLGICS